MLLHDKIPDLPASADFSQPEWGHSVDLRRLTRGWSQQRLANEAGVSIGLVQRIAAGARVSKPTVNKIEAALARSEHPHTPQAVAAPSIGPRPEKKTSPAPNRLEVSWEASLAALRIVFDTPGELRTDLLRRLEHCADQIELAREK